jgi:hypothetical protein
MFLGILIFVVGELFASFLFYFLNKKFMKSDTKDDELIKKIKIDYISLIKGILERGVMFLGLLLSYPQILILFGALKIGTRFKSDEKISNDYFFIGNIVSVLFVLIYFAVFEFVTK